MFLPALCPPSPVHSSPLFGRPASLWFAASSLLRVGILMKTIKVGENRPQWGMGHFQWITCVSSVASLPECSQADSLYSPITLGSRLGGMMSTTGQVGQLRLTGTWRGWDNSRTM